MSEYPVRFDAEKLRAALDLIPEVAWNSKPSSYAKTGVHHGYRQAMLYRVGVAQEYAELFKFVFDELAPIWDAWLSSLPPGGFIAPHCDAGPYRERWQVPICVGAQWRDEQISTPIAGRAFRVSHWQPHAVVNSSVHSRIHIVIDRDVMINSKPEPFQIYPVPEDMAEMVRRSQ